MMHSWVTAHHLKNIGQCNAIALKKLFRSLDQSLLRHSITLTAGIGSEFHVTQYSLVKSKGRLFIIRTLRKDVSSVNKGPMYLGDVELHLSSPKINPTHRRRESQ